MEMQQYEVATKARHLRYVFFVEAGYDCKKLMDLFRINQNFWGGRLNPIVPVENGVLSNLWKSVAVHYDPDYVFYTANIGEEAAIKLCSDLGYNPVEVANLDDMKNSMDGVYSHQLFDLFSSYKHFVLVNEAWKTDSPLRGFFELNYSIDDVSHTRWPADGRFDSFMVRKNQYGLIAGDISTHPNFFNRNLLASANLNTTVLREKNLDAKYFELVITRDYNSFDDLIYFWNRNLYVEDQSYINQFIITLDQFNLLIADPTFGTILNQTYSEQSEIDIVSYSLSNEELIPLADQLKGTAKLKRFEIKGAPKFPFEILDANGLRGKITERESIQIVSSPEHLITNPPLSFGGPFNNTPQKWALDVRIASLKRGTLKFPFTYDPYVICGNESRVNRDREVSLIMHSQRNDKPVLKIKIPNFWDTARQLITNPRFVKKSADYAYSHVRYNDASSRLKEFINLFDNDFQEVQHRFSDKFWVDHFTDLSTNTRTEGDCFTLDELLQKCVKVMEVAGAPLDEETRYNLKNLRSGLMRTVRVLCHNKILLPGFIVKCRHCSSKVWYSVNSIKDKVICTGCSNLNAFQAETSFSYKLNHLVKNNISTRDKNGKIVPDGNMTVIRTLTHLALRWHTSFEFLPQLDVFELPSSKKPDTDLDIMCLIGGRLFIGECKHTSSLFKEDKYKSLDNLLKIAEKIRPDTIVISCTIDENNGLQKAQKFLEGRMKGWEYKPNIMAYISKQPDYYAIKRHQYFE